MAETIIPATQASQHARYPDRRPIIDRSLNYGRHAIREFVQNATPVERILDVGAGGGADLETCRQVAPNAELHGIEGFRTFIDQLLEKNVHVTEINIEREEFPFGDETFDVVVANQVMEHIKDIFWVLHNVTRILKPGGIFILGVPNLASLHNRLLLALGQQPTSIQSQSAHIRGYTKPDILKLVAHGFPGGFELAGFRGGNFYPFPSGLAKPLANIFPSMAVSIFLSLKKVKPYRDSWLRYPVEAQLNTSFFVGNENPLWTIDT